MPEKKAPAAIRGIDQESIDKAMDTIAKSLRNSKRNTNRKPTPREGTCRVCQGVITEDFYLHSDVPRDLRPIGPGSANGAKWKSTGLSCKDCGLKYERIPKSFCSACLMVDGKHALGCLKTDT